jgi:hypothetical protein
VRQAAQRRGATKQLCRTHAGCAQLTDAGIASGLAQLAAIGMPNQRVVQKLDGCGTAEEPSEAQLASGGCE